MTMLRNYLKRAFSLLPEGLQGRLEYRLRPSLSSGFGPLNDQTIRMNIFERLAAELNIGQIVETGTFRATTTAYFAQTGLPVYSIEVSPKLYEYSKLKLRSASNVFLYHGDSVSRLPEICSRLAIKKRPTFVYLDSHWRDYLPLRNEIEILSKYLPNSITMIDDFEVPGDLGYGFDDYGGGKRLSVDYLAGSKTALPIFVYFPAAPSSKETGRKRGTCVVVFTPELRQYLDAFDLLRFHGAIEPRRGVAMSPAG